MVSRHNCLNQKYKLTRNHFAEMQQFQGCSRIQVASNRCNQAYSLNTMMEILLTHMKSTAVMRSKLRQLADGAQQCTRQPQSLRTSLLVQRGRELMIIFHPSLLHCLAFIPRPHSPPSFPTLIPCPPFLLPLTNVHISFLPSLSTVLYPPHLTVPTHCTPQTQHPNTRRKANPYSVKPSRLLQWSGAPLS